MQTRGQRPGSSNPSVVPATDDEIREKYLERAIRELNQLTHEIQSCDHCPRGSLMPVLGSGHPQADVFMLSSRRGRRRSRRASPSTAAPAAR
jgi:uracil-DNA glycosylase